MRLRRLITTFAVAMLLPMALCSCSSVSFVKNLTMTDDGVHKPSEYPVLRATGYASISRQPGATDAIKQIKAMRASKIEAYRELSEQVNGIYIRATDTLNSSNIETSNSVKSEVDGFVHERIMNTSRFVFNKTTPQNTVRPLKDYLDGQKEILEKLEKVIQAEYESLKDRHLENLKPLSEMKSDLMLKLQSSSSLCVCSQLISCRQFY